MAASHSGPRLARVFVPPRSPPIAISPPDHAAARSCVYRQRRTDPTVKHRVQESPGSARSPGHCQRDTLPPEQQPAAQDLAAQRWDQRYRQRLMAVVAATIAALALAWARNGAIAGLLDGVLDHVRALFGIA